MAAGQGSGKIGREDQRGEDRPVGSDSAFPPEHPAGDEGTPTGLRPHSSPIYFFDCCLNFRQISPTNTYF